jgi:hypothetical protein
MPYTRLSLITVWLLVTGLIAATVIYAPSGVVLVCIVLLALVTPSLLLRRPGPAARV